MILVTSGYSICFVAQEMKTNKQKVGLKEKSALKCGFFLGRKSFPAKKKRFKKLLEITQKCKKKKKKQTLPKSKMQTPPQKTCMRPPPPGGQQLTANHHFGPPKKEHQAKRSRGHCFKTASDQKKARQRQTMRFHSFCSCNLAPPPSRHPLPISVRHDPPFNKRGR